LRLKAKTAMKFIKRRRWIFVLAALVAGGGIFQALRQDPLAGLSNIKADYVEANAQQYPDGTGELTRTYYFSGNAAPKAFKLLQKDLLGRGWKMLMADKGYAMYSPSERSKRDSWFDFNLSKTQAKDILAAPGTHEVYWLQYDDGKKTYAIVHEYRQVSKLRASVLTFLHLMKPAPPASSVFSSPAPGRKLTADDALGTAAAKDDVAGAQAALKAGAKIGGAPRNPPIFWALRSGSISVAQMLLDRGADINAHAMAGRTAVDTACAGHLDALRFAFAHGGKFSDDGTKSLVECATAPSLPDYLLLPTSESYNPKPPAAIKDWPVTYAVGDDGMMLDDLAWKNSAAAAKLLIAHGANVNGVAYLSDYAGRTPLQLAAALGNAPVVKVLLEAGANPRTRDPKGKSSLDLALSNKMNQWRETVRLLQDAIATRKATTASKSK